MVARRAAKNHRTPALTPSVADAGSDRSMMSGGSSTQSTVLLGGSTRSILSGPPGSARSFGSEFSSGVQSRGDSSHSSHSALSRARRAARSAAGKMRRASPPLSDGGNHTPEEVDAGSSERRRRDKKKKSSSSSKRRSRGRDRDRGHRSSDERDRDRDHYRDRDRDRGNRSGGDRGSGTGIGENDARGGASSSPSVRRKDAIAAGAAAVAMDDEPPRSHFDDGAGAKKHVAAAPSSPESASADDAGNDHHDAAPEPSSSAMGDTATSSRPLHERNPLPPPEDRLVRCFCVLGPNGKLAKKAKKKKRKEKAARSSSVSNLGFKYESSGTSCSSQSETDDSSTGRPRRQSRSSRKAAAAAAKRANEEAKAKAPLVWCHQNLSKLSSPDEVELQTSVIDEFPFLAGQQKEERRKKASSPGNKSSSSAPPGPSLVPSNLSKFVFPEGCQPCGKEKPPTCFTFALPTLLDDDDENDGNVAATGTRRISSNPVSSSGSRRSATILYGAAMHVYDYTIDMASLRNIAKRSRYTGPLPDWMAAAEEEEDDDEHDHAGDGGDPAAAIGRKTKKRPNSGGAMAKKRKIHLPRCFVVLSHHPCYDTFASFLKQLYRISLSYAPLPIERYLANFVCEVPLPPRGRVAVEFGYYYPGGDLDRGVIARIARSPPNRLPSPECADCRPLFATLSVGNVMVVFGLLMQETRVVLCSKRYSLLGPVSEALLSLLFPFVWQGIYIPVLPRAMVKDVLHHRALSDPDSVVPYLIGIHSRYLAETKGRKRPHGVVFVDLDDDAIHLGCMDGSVPDLMVGDSASVSSRTSARNKACRDTPCLPESEAAKLRSRLEKYGGMAYLYGGGAGGGGEASEGGPYQPGKITLGVRAGYMDNSYREAYATAPQVFAARRSGSISSIGTEDGRRRRAAAMNGDFDSARNSSCARERVLATADLAFPDDVSNRFKFSAHYKRGRSLLFQSADDTYPWRVMGAIAKENNVVDTAGVEMYAAFSSPRVDLFEKDESRLQKLLGSFVGTTCAYLTFARTLLLYRITCCYAAVETTVFLQSDGFSAKEIRNAFLRFFIATLQNYANYISYEKKRKKFLGRDFVSKEFGNHKRGTREFMTTVLSTKMFDAFLSERLRTKTIPADIRLFDESIVANKIVSSKKLTDLQQETPFLADRSNLVIETYKPPPPSNYGLPNDGRTYRYKVFPKLDSSLFGTTRPPRQWQDDRTRRKSISSALLIKRGIIHKLLDQQASGPKPSLLVPSACLIQAKVRMYTERKQFHLLRNCTIVIQSNYQRHPRRVLRRSLVFVQAWWRACQCTLEYHALREAAFTIQRRQRGSYVRQIVFKYVRYSRAATSIQRAYRPFAVRLRSDKRLGAILLLQCAFRGWEARRHCRTAAAAAAKVQSLWRGRRTRFVYELIRDLVATAQARIRGFLTRRIVRTLREAMVIHYRAQLFELWKRACTPLVYRSKFWAFIEGSSFLHLGVYEDELMKQWEDLGVFQPSFHHFRGISTNNVRIDRLDVPSMRKANPSPGYEGSSPFVTSHHDHHHRHDHPDGRGEELGSDRWMPGSNRKGALRRRKKSPAPLSPVARLFPGVVFVDGKEMPSTPISRIFALVYGRLEITNVKGLARAETVPVFPAEITAARKSQESPKNKRESQLLKSSERLGLEKIYLYEKLGSKECSMLREEIFSFLFIEKSEKEKKKNIIEGLWQSFDFVHYSARIVLCLQPETSVPRVIGVKTLDDEGDSASSKTRIYNSADISMETLMHAFRLVEVKDRRWRLRMYKQSFVGSDAVDLLVSIGYAESREDAVRIGRRLASEYDLFESAHKSPHDFEDDHKFYRFKNPTETPGPAATATAAAAAAAPASARSLIPSFIHGSPYAASFKGKNNRSATPEREKRAASPRNHSGGASSRSLDSNRSGRAALKSHSSRRATPQRERLAANSSKHAAGASSRTTDSGKAGTSTPERVPASAKKGSRSAKSGKPFSLRNLKSGSNSHMSKSRRTLFSEGEGVAFPTSEDWAQRKIRKHIRNILQEVSSSPRQILPLYSHHVKKVHSPPFLRQRWAIVSGMRYEEWSSQRFLIIRRFLTFGRWYAKRDARRSQQ